jgi:hypothetical protein
MYPVRGFLVGLLLGVTLAFPAYGLDTFRTEAQARQHCPADTVVWLNLPTKIWHYSSEGTHARRTVLLYA